MTVVRSDRDIPTPPPRRPQRGQRFTTLLLFARVGQRQVCQWVPVPLLVEHWQNLEPRHVERNDLEWLHHFLNRLRDETQPASERDLARQHLQAFYQAVCFWTLRKLWRKLTYVYPIADWEVSFDLATRDFQDTAKLAQSLRNFDPDRSVNKYVERICYRQVNHWLARQTGGQRQLQMLAFEEAPPNDDAGAWSQQQTINTAIASEQAQQAERARVKLASERLWQAIARELAQVEDRDRQGSGETVGRTGVGLWPVLLSTYGLNLGQSGSAIWLQANQKTVNQSTIARLLQRLRVGLFAQCAREFARELPARWRDVEAPLETGALEGDRDFQAFAETQKAAIEACLDLYCRDWLYQRVLQPLACDLRQSGASPALADWIVQTLADWLLASFHLQFQLSFFSQALVKKLNQAIAQWRDRLDGS